MYHIPRLIKTSTKSIVRTYGTRSNSYKFNGIISLSALAASLALANVVFDNQSESAASTVDIKAVKQDIIKLIEFDNDFREDGTSIAGTLVRLAWHASGTYSNVDHTGGSNGSTMRYPPESQWGANVGLAIAREFLNPVKRKYPELSYADIWTLAGAVAIEQMGGPEIPWRSGRTDSTTPTTVPDGRLPSANKGSPDATAAHVREVFTRLGFTEREAIALIGAHAVGRCHTDASGFWGPWTRAETTFSNQYFRLLLDENWTEKKTHEGKPWTGPLQYESADGSLMMLPSDLVLIQDPEFKKIVQIYADDEKKFFEDFSTSFSKLLELGVPFKSTPKKRFLW